MKTLETFQGRIHSYEWPSLEIRRLFLRPLPPPPTQDFSNKSKSERRWRGSFTKKGGHLFGDDVIQEGRFYFSPTEQSYFRHFNSFAHPSKRTICATIIIIPVPHLQSTLVLSAEWTTVIGSTHIETQRIWTNINRKRQTEQDPLGVWHLRSFVKGVEKKLSFERLPK